MYVMHASSHEAQPIFRKNGALNFGIYFMKIVADMTVLQFVLFKINRSSLE